MNTPEIDADIAKRLDQLISLVQQQHTAIKLQQQELADLRGAIEALRHDLAQGSEAASTPGPDTAKTPGSRGGRKPLFPAAEDAFDDPFADDSETRPPAKKPERTAPPKPATDGATIFCDGACSGNPGPGGWACIVERNGSRQEISGGKATTTNNQMEMKALIEGIKSLPPGASVRVVTDSEYLAKGITSWVKGWVRNGWRTASNQPVKNQDLWEELHLLLQEHPHKVDWVKGHDGHPENERCDELARAAIKEFRQKRPNPQPLP